MSLLVAARHEPRVGSPTPNLFKRLSKVTSYCVITEGLRSHDVIHRKDRSGMRSVEKEAVTFRALYAALLCSEKEIPFRGELSHSDDRSASKVTEDDIDILGYLVVRHLGQVRREQPGAELDKNLRNSTTNDTTVRA